MPYASNAELPPSIRGRLPGHAQDIFRAAFNHAFEAHRADLRCEEIAFRIAWAAVKRSYVKQGGRWLPSFEGPVSASRDRAAGPCAPIGWSR